MSQHHTPFLYPTQLTIPPEIRVYSIQILNQTLACTMDLRSHAKQAAWNVRGPAFSLLHHLFLALATKLDAYADLIAERIVVLGGITRGTVRMAAVQSTLLEYPSDLVEGSAHVRALVERLAPYATALRTDMTHAADIEGVGTATVYTDMLCGIEKQLGVFEAHLYP